jgi:hypothetical protein
MWGVTVIFEVNLKRSSSWSLPASLRQIPGRLSLLIDVRSLVVAPTRMQRNVILLSTVYHSRFSATDQMIQLLHHDRMTLQSFVDYPRRTVYENATFYYLEPSLARSWMTG